MTVPDLRSSFQNPSALYLENAHLLLALINASHSTILSTVAQPPAFSPPRYAVWVNSLWFLSFVISLTYAMLVTMLHQWASRYIMVTQQSRNSPHKKGLVRAFFSEAFGGFPVVVWMVEGLRVMIHLSLFPFFAGLAIFLFNVNHFVFGAVVWWMVLSTTVHMCITFLPIWRPNSPYYTPLSSTIWVLYTGVLYVVLKVLSSPQSRTSHHFRNLKVFYRKRLVEGMGTTAEKTASQRSTEIGVRVLISALGDDGSKGVFSSHSWFLRLCTGQRSRRTIPRRVSVQV